jgi:hypothetical protein
MMTRGLSKKQFQMGIVCDNNSYICDYYICMYLFSDPSLILTAIFGYLTNISSFKNCFEIEIASTSF